MQYNTHEERVAHAKSIAEGYIDSARTRHDFGGEDSYSYAYAFGLTAGWFHGALISEKEMDQYRSRLRDAVLDREEEDGPDESELEQERAWSISARLAALVLDDASKWPPQLIALVQEARELHPAMAPKEPHDNQKR